MVFYNVSEDEFNFLNEDGTSGMTEKHPGKNIVMFSI